jgi:putative transposase
MLEGAEDHVHIFLSFPPRYRISKVVGMLKGISASVIFREHTEVKKELWGGEFWEDGYFARPVGDKVTAEVIRNHIKYHPDQETSLTQLEYFKDAPLCRGVIHSLRIKLTVILWQAVREKVRIKFGSSPK